MATGTIDIEATGGGRERVKKAEILKSGESDLY